MVLLLFFTERGDSYLMKNKTLFGVCGGVKSCVEAAGRGADYVDLHFKTEEELIEALGKAGELGIGIVANLEGQPLDWVPSPKLRSVLEGNNAFLGFMLDECDHMQLNAHWPVIEYYGYKGKHYFADTDGMDLDRAQEAVEGAIRERVKALTIDGKDVAGEYLYPGMMHTAARAGLSASPKILKETCGPVMIAAALGASLQYGGTFGIDCDAWWHPESVGHTDERFASALKLAYYAGADRIYIEGGFGACGHPSEVTQPWLLEQMAGKYAPAHIRNYSWRDYKPEVAIIRQDDTCFDIRQRSPLEYPGPLYGHIPAGEENTEWLNILNLLSHGYVRNDSASRNWECRSVLARTLFAPFYKLVIFDETVKEELLTGIRLFFLTGLKISRQTYQAVTQKVREGSACVAPQRFAPEKFQKEFQKENKDEPVSVVEDGAGKWMIVKDFYSLHYETWTSGPCNPVLHRELMPLIGDGDTLVYEFGNSLVRAFLKKKPVGKGKVYPCNEIPRALWEAEDDMEFMVEERV